MSALEDMLSMFSKEAILAILAFGGMDDSLINWITKECKKNYSYQPHILVIPYNIYHIHTHIVINHDQLNEILKEMMSNYIPGISMLLSWGALPIREKLIHLFH